MTTTRKNKKNDLNITRESNQNNETGVQLIFDDENLLNRMLHVDESPELANELIEWEEDGEGHLISK